MKKIYVVVVVLILALTLNASDKDLRLIPNGGVQETRDYSLLTNYVYELYNVDNSEWNQVYNCDYTYNEDNQLEQLLVENRPIDEWSEFELYTYSYNEENLKSNLLYQIMLDEWTNYQNESYEYNSNNLTTVYLLQKWENESWQDSLQITYTYDDLNLIDEEWTYFTPAKDVEVYRRSYEYDVLGYVTLELWESSVDAVNWENYSKCEYSRDDESYLLSEHWYTFDSGVWEDYSKYDYNYNSNMDVELLESFSYDNGWVNVSLVEYEYEAYEYASSRTKQSWNTVDEVWENYNRYLYQYMNIVSNTNDVESIALNISVSPNPFSSSLKVETDTQMKSICIYNIKGQRVSQMEITGLKSVWSGKSSSGEELPSGVYFIRVIDNSGRSSIVKTLKLK